MTISQHSTFRGIGGWLLLLCIILIVAVPLSILATISNGVELLDSIGDRFPGFSTLSISSQILNFGLFCYSIYAGVSLLKIKKGAVAKAQYFLIAYASFYLLRVLIPYAGNLPLDFREKLLGIYSFSALRISVFAAVWHQYLARSVRVKNTFDM